ncbi:lipopolysaccharide biosynthesis protein [Halosolutus amylolyticus]|uniref:Lipopolysaccharide biosynthesis protein n=1 Tax=Halosolutus amylolyticus TaxID=2932267 RepID=A0ABD5PTL0_9EURY|nr:oligosaccharide flippase family protein [Halosolutus amylolyticus]
MNVGEADFGLEISRGVLAKFAMAAIGFAGSVIFARVLGPSGYGTFYVVLTLVHVLDNPVTGWGGACKKRISETGFPTAEALGSGLFGAVLLPLIMLPIVYTFHYFTDIYDLTGLFIPFSTLFTIICFFAVTNRILSARSNFSAAEWSDTLRSLFTTPLQLVFITLGFGTAGMVYGLTLATALTVPYVIYRIHVKPVLPTRESLFSIASYAKYSIPNGFIGTAQSRFDILLLGALLTSSAVGDYQVAMQLTLAGTFIGAVTSKGLMARVSEHWSRNDKSAVVTDVTNSLGYASVLAIPIFFGAAAMPNTLVETIFGSQYTGIGLVLVGLAFFRVLKVQSAQLQSTMAGLDRPDINMRIGIIVLILNVGLGYLLLLKYGILGVVGATIISEVVRYTALAYMIKQYLPDVPLFSQPLRFQLFAGSVMFVLVDHLHTTTGVSWWGDLLILVGLGGLIYFGSLTVISESFRITAKGILSDALNN